MSQPALHPARRGEPPLQLGHGHDRTGEGDRTNEHRHHDRHQRHWPSCLEGQRVERRRQGHQQRRHAATAVEQGHRLRHRGHRHPLSGNGSERPSNQRANDDPDPGSRGNSACA